MKVKYEVEVDAIDTGTEGRNKYLVAMDKSYEGGSKGGHQFAFYHIIRAENEEEAIKKYYEVTKFNPAFPAKVLNMIDGEDHLGRVLKMVDDSDVVLKEFMDYVTALSPEQSSFDIGELLFSKWMYYDALRRHNGIHVLSRDELEKLVQGVECELKNGVVIPAGFVTNSPKYVALLEKRVRTGAACYYNDKSKELMVR